MNQLPWTNETHFFIKIYISFYSRKEHKGCCKVWEIDGETCTQRGDFFLPQIFFLEQGGANAWTPLQAGLSQTTFSV